MNKKRDIEIEMTLEDKDVERKVKMMTGKEMIEIKVMTRMKRTIKIIIKIIKQSTTK